MNDVVARLTSLSEQKQKLLQQLLPAQAKPTTSDQLAPRAAGTTSLPLSHAQRGLWFLSRLAPDSSFYHMPYAVHLAGRLDIPALSRAFDRMIQRHEALRTTFPEVEGKPVQRIAPRLSLTIPVVDLERQPAHEREAVALQRASDEALRPFDLAEGPLLRVVLYRLDGDTHLLVFSMHHIVSDGWSVGVMMQEIGVLYEAFRHGRHDPLPELPLQYADYALWQAKRFQEGALDGQLEYWRGQLDSTLPLNLPTDFPRPPVQRYRGASVPVRIPEAVTAALEALGRQEGATLFMALLAAFQSLLFLHSGTRRVVVGTPVANRTPRETEPLIGFFANTLALSTDCSGDPSFLTLLARARETTLGAFANQDVPFEMLVEALQVERDPSRNPLFQVMFGLQSVSVREFGLPGIVATPWILDNDTTHFDLELQLWHRDDHVGGYLSYNLDLFERDTIDRLLSRFHALLQSVVSDPHASLASHGSKAGIPSVASLPCAQTEAALLAHPAVEDCTVLIRERGQTTDMVAYVVPSLSLDADAVRRTLPPPLTPAAIVPVSVIPRTAQGEIDESTLRAMPVIDAAVISQWERALAAREEVAQVHVEIAEPQRARSWLHLADLLPLQPVLERTAPRYDPPISPVTEAPSARPAFSDGGPLQIPPDAPRTLIDALLHTAFERADQGIVFVQEGAGSDFLSYADLLRAARSILAGLQAQGLKAGDRVILQLANLQDHFCAFWACVLGGIVPVTVALPPSYRERGGVLNKLWNVWTLLHHPIVLTNAALAPRLSEVPTLFDAGASDAFRVWTVEPLRASPDAARLHTADPEEVVFLQLTSGSTGVPKCVQETHRAIVHHIHGSRQAHGYRADAISLNWLPLDHVVPILTCHLRDTYLGVRQVQVSTTDILTEPLKWLDLIEAHRVTHTWAPNFGFKLLSDRLTRTPGKRWDLSSIQSFMNAGEQVTEPVVREFLSLLAPFGVRSDAMQPAFGMAEVATCMTYHAGFDMATGVHHVVKSTLNGPLQMAANGESGYVAFVDLGPPMPGVQIRITDDDHRVLPERMIGRLQIRGPVVMPGYLDNPQANREAFACDGWFDSGDLGFLCRGRLTLTGRAKETIIIRGANFYCHEIEDVVNAVEGVAPTFCAACAVQVPHKGTEGLAIFFVPQSAAVPADPTLGQRIRDQVSRQLGISPDFVIPLPKADFPKTTSGKIQRTHLKQALEAGHYAATLKAIDLAEENANCLPDWFYQRDWQVVPIRHASRTPAPGVTLVFADRTGLAEHFLAQDANAIRVEPGTAFDRVSGGHYRIDPRQPKAYQKLLEAIAADQRQIGRILHLWTYDAAAPVPEDLEQAQYRGSYSVLLLAQALALAHQSDRSTGLQLLVCSSHVQAVNDGAPLDCRHTPILGLLRSLGREMPWLSCRHIDLPTLDPASNAAWVAQEAASPDKEPEVAYREGIRWVPRLSKAVQPHPKSLPLKRGGFYLISGGLGGIGRILARYLLTHRQARLLLVGRAPAGQVAEALTDLARLGGDVQYVAADVCDPAQMRAALEGANGRWHAPLDGIFHLAGSFRTRALTDETIDSFAEGLRAKLLGSDVLHSLAPPGALFVHVASVNGILGGAMAGAYSAANSFTQAFSHYQRHVGGLRSTCLSFSMWDEVGMSQGYPLKEQSRAQGYFQIDAGRGLNSLLVALAADHPHLLIGLDGERPNIRRHLKHESHPLTQVRAYVVPTAGRPAPPATPPIADRYGTPCPCELVLTDGLPDGPRTRAVAPQAQPSTALQRRIAAIWQEVLGLPSVGIHQSFFEIGGQSLSLVQVHSRLQAALNREIHIVDLLQYPTISALATFLGEAPVKTAAFEDAVQRARRQQLSLSQRRKPLPRTPQSS